MATSGQTLNDRINAARYALAGQGLARCVCKATTEEVIGPKKKHLDYLLACTHEPNVSIPQLANLLIERTNHIYWVVVFKALVTVHHLMSYGNERFTQYLASSNYSFELSTFLDKTAARDFSMSAFIRRYSRYINEKALSYRLLAFDFCKIKRGNEGVLRLMPIDRLLKTLPILQNQLDALLEFDCCANDLNNGVINACFMLLFRDLIGLFACHNDGIINLLNKYFNLNRKLCREALDLYKKFLVRMDKVSDFLRVAEVVGIDKDEIPDLRRAPSSLIDALEQHLQNFESIKKVHKQQSVTGASSSKEFSTLGNLTPPSLRRPNSPGSLALNSATTSNSQSDEITIENFKDDEVRKALEEEARVLSQFEGGKSIGYSKSGSSAKGVSLNKTSSVVDNNSPKFAVTTIPKSIDDIFGDSDSFSGNVNNNNNGKTHSDNNGAFDNISTSSSSSSTTKHRPDFDTIKSSIKSATTSLEKANNLKALESKPPSKKASDDLFSLLTDTSSSIPGQPTDVSTFAGAKLPPPLSLSNASPFSSSPFNLSSNGQMTLPLKPGNPFPEVGSDFMGNSAFRAGGFPSVSNIQPTPAQSSIINYDSNSVFKSGTSTANYTNLGGLEGFGDLLQPTSSNKTTANSGSAFGTSKPSFNSGAGLASTGLFKGDLDSTLANLAQNLTFDGITKTKK